MMPSSVASASAAQGAEENGVQSGLEVVLEIAPDRNQPPPSYWDRFQKREGLKPLEDVKLEYFKNFLFRFRSTLTWQQCFDLVKQCEQDIRDCYAEEINGLDTDEFVEMILVDSGFIVELFLRDREDYFIDADDQRTRNPTMRTSLSHDLKLLENQIPMVIIRVLYDRILTTNNKPCVLELAISFFSEHNMQSLQPDSPDKVLHFADLIRTFFKPQSPRTAGSQSEILVFKYVNSATQLHDAGLKFKVSPSNCFLDIKLENGVLEIPCLNVYDATKPLLKNLMALETPIAKRHIPNVKPSTLGPQLLTSHPRMANYLFLS
ncbi:hypothetical protein RJ640_002745 [Escallonia rubra]|uniref:Uncharacterized protein n=1 Tax=Escallonia rubra TaxID=112253 RepID=A0AA88RST5_9ASTE|nr:hypothetical protein RJ640_002745 [Escallonia rubra]